MKDAAAQSDEVVSLPVEVDWVHRYALHGTFFAADLPLVRCEEVLYRSVIPDFSLHLVRVNHDTVTRYVAVRKVNKVRLHENQEVDLLKNDVRLLGRCKMFCATLLGCQEDPMYIYILQEYCLLGNLSQLIDMGSFWYASNKYFYFNEVVQMFKYLHNQKQICLRTLSIEALYIASNGRLKLLHFMNAISMDEKIQPRRRVLDIRSMFEFAAPEVIPESLTPSEYSDVYTSSDIDDFPGCDVWSLGLVLYYMLFKKHLFGRTYVNDVESVCTSILGGKKLCFRNELLRVLLCRDAGKRYTLEKLENMEYLKKKLRKGRYMKPSSKQLKIGNYSAYGLCKGKYQDEGVLTKDIIQSTFFGDIIEELRQFHLSKA